MAGAVPVDANRPEKLGIICTLVKKEQQRSCHTAKWCVLHSSHLKSHSSQMNGGFVAVGELAFTKIATPSTSVLAFVTLVWVFVSV